jgi:hypothetical protein
VVIGEPQISEVVAPPAAIYSVDPSVAPGNTRQVDWEARGMTVAVQRTITENGATRVDTLRSKYQPWRAVYLVGSESQVPATPTPANPATEAVTATGEITDAAGEIILEPTATPVSEEAEPTPP